jgi:hypothetical protein
MSDTLNAMQTEVYLNTSPDVNKSSLWLKPISGKTSPLFPESTVWVNLPTKSAQVNMANFLREIFGKKVATLVIDLTAIQATSNGSMNIKFADFAALKAAMRVTDKQVVVATTEEEDEFFTDLLGLVAELEIQSPVTDTNDEPW